jgi:hypothetical protein
VGVTVGERVMIGNVTVVRLEVGEPARVRNNVANASMVNTLYVLLVAVTDGSFVETLRLGSW